MDKTLNEILHVAGFSDDEKQDMKTSFYRLLAFKTLMGVKEVDEQSYEDLKKAFEEAETGEDRTYEVLMRLYENPQIKDSIDTQVEEVVDKVVKTVMESATEKQKRQILASLIS